MKQLLQATNHAVVCALNDRAFLIVENRTIELLAVTVPSTTKAMPMEDTTIKDMNNKEQDDDCNDYPTHDTIQAVALMEHQDGTIWCAVSRFHKSLALYQITKKDEQQQQQQLEPKIFHATTKRAGCLAFSTVQDNLDVIIAGDLTGDATAFPLDRPNHKGRLLLGHTASMLTGVRVALQGTVLLTCDRDEKVRISQFPNTAIVQGYLLGHKAFVSCMDVAMKWCVTCGGDSTVRLWNITTFQEVSQVDTQEKLPTRVAISLHGSFVAVIYEGLPTLDIYQLDNGTMTLMEQQQCSAQPLAVVFSTDSDFFVLISAPDYLVSYSIESNKVIAKEGTFSAIQELAKDITMPTSVMEMDKNGVIKLKKLSEERGPAKEKPWNRVERIQTSREGNARRNKKRRQEENADH